MKKFILVALAAFLVAVAGYSQNTSGEEKKGGQDDYKSLLVGKWKLVEQEFQMFIGDGKGTWDNDEYVYSKASFDYKYKNVRLERDVERFPNSDAMKVIASGPKHPITIEFTKDHEFKTNYQSLVSRNEDDIEMAPVFTMFSLWDKPYYGVRRDEIVGASDGIIPVIIKELTEDVLRVKRGRYKKHAFSYVAKYVRVK